MSKDKNMKGSEKPNIEQKEVEVASVEEVASIPVVDVEEVVAVQETEQGLSNIKTTTDLEALDYEEFKTPARMLALGSVLVKSQLVPLKKAEDVFACLKTGQELGLPFMVSVTQIYPINGRATLGVHLQKALCLQNGVAYTKIENAVPIYAFYKANEEGKPVLDEKKQPILIIKDTLENQPPNSVKHLTPVDHRTTYEATRAIKLADGSFKQVTARGSFSLAEATEAGLTEKDVWQKYWRRMLDARAFTNLAREIASDITNGIYAPSELSDNFYINEQGQEVPYTN